MWSHIKDYRSRSAIMVGFLALGVALAACGGPEPTATPTATPTVTPPPAATPTPTPTPTPLPPGVTPPPRPTATSTPTPAPTPSRDLAEYLSGKTVEIVVPFAPGGSTDIFGRFFAKIARQYIPGEPRLIVKNVAGGGGERGLIYVMRSKPDGLRLVSNHGRHTRRWVAGREIPDFDPRTAISIGNPNAGTRVSMFLVHNSVARSWEDVLALGQPITIGSTERGSSTKLPMEFLELTGAPVKVIFGYGGSAEARRAFVIREVDAEVVGGRLCKEWPPLYPEFMEEREFSLLFWFGVAPEQASENESYRAMVECWDQLGLAHPPHMVDVLTLSDGQVALFRALSSIQSFEYMLPVGTPDDMVVMWRGVMKKVTDDPAFFEPLRALGHEVEYRSADEYFQVVTKVKEQIERDPELAEIAKLLFAD